MISWLDMSQTRIKRIGSGLCHGFSRLTVAFLPPTLEWIGDDCFRGSSVQGLDLSMTALESVGDSFCRGCKALREVSLPPTLKVIRS
jgi:hypothetical protein